MEKRRMMGIVGIIISIAMIITLGILLSMQHIELLFKKTIPVSNIVELENCQEGDYIQLEVANAYLTEYSYEENGKQVAKFVDIDINGKALLAVVENQFAEKIEKRRFRKFDHRRCFATYYTRGHASQYRRN